MVVIDPGALPIIVLVGHLAPLILCVVDCQLSEIVHPSLICHFSPSIPQVIGDASSQAQLPY